MNDLVDMFDEVDTDREPSEYCEYCGALNTDHDETFPDLCQVCNDNITNDSINEDDDEIDLRK